MGVWRLVSKSATTVVSLDEAKKQTNVDFTDDDDYLLALCAVVTEYLDLAVGVTRRPLLTQTWEYLATAPVWSSEVLAARRQGWSPTRGFLLDRAPMQQIEKVEALQFGSYVIVPETQYALRSISEEWTWLRTRGEWPQTDCDEAAWRITVKLGYGDAVDSVPRPLRQAALLLLAHLYQNRESVGGGSSFTEVPMGFEALIGPFRLLDI